MAWVATAIVGSAVVTSYASSKASSKAASATTAAAERGAEAQEEAARLGIEEQRRQFDEITKILEPYVSAGQAALPGFAPFQEAGELAFQEQQALSGLLGPDAQRSAISQLEQAPEFQALTRQGEEALLQRASATGGLRGGNVQAALAQFRPQMLSAQIERQLGRLGGFSATGLGVTSDLASMGQASATRQAALGGQTGANVSNLLGQIGSAQAGAAGTIGAAQSANAIAQAQALGNLASSIPNALIMSRFLQPSGTMVLGGGF
jgi:hypothetical protein